MEKTLPSPSQGSSLGPSKEKTRAKQALAGTRATIEAIKSSAKGRKASKRHYKSRDEKPIPIIESPTAVKAIQKVKAQDVKEKEAKKQAIEQAVSKVVKPKEAIAKAKGLPATSITSWKPIPRPILTKNQEERMWHRAIKQGSVALADGHEITGFDLYRVHQKHPNLYRTLLEKGYEAYKKELQKDYTLTVDGKVVKKEFIKELVGKYPEAYDVLKASGFEALKAQVAGIENRQHYLSKFKDKTGKVDVLKVAMDLEANPKSEAFLDAHGLRDIRGIFAEVGGTNPNEYRDLQYVARYLLGKEKAGPALKGATEAINKAGRYRELTKKPDLPDIGRAEGFIPEYTSLLERQARPKRSGLTISGRSPRITPRMPKISG